VHRRAADARDGWRGAAYGSKHRTTIGDPKQPRHPDLVDRNFSPAAPNRLWVADFTYCPTWTGMVYVAFVTTPTPAGSSAGGSLAG
jgi:putative transposase